MYSTVQKTHTCMKFKTIRTVISFFQIEDSDLKFLQSRLGTRMEPGSTTEDSVPTQDTNGQGASYSSNLDNPGNSRSIAKFIRETKKPKSILLSSTNRSNRVSDILFSF